METNNQEQKRFRFRAMPFLLVLFVLFIFGFAFKEYLFSVIPMSSSITGYAAAVNGEVIRVTELNSEYGSLGTEANQITKQQYLEQMIEQKMILQAIERQGTTVQDAEVSQFLSDAQIKNNVTIKEIQEYFNAETIEELYTKIKRQLLVTKYLNQTVLGNISITPEDVKGYYDQNPNDFLLPEQVRVAHILIKADNKDSKNVDGRLQSIINDLKKDIPFEELARKYSEDEGTKESGGDLGYIYRGQTVPEFESVAFVTPVNEVSKTFKSRFGFHIVKAYDKVPSRLLDFEEVKDRLANLLLSQKQKEVFNEHLAKLREESKVYVYVKDK